MLTPPSTSLPISQFKETKNLTRPYLFHPLSSNSLESTKADTFAFLSSQSRNSVTTHLSFFSISICSTDISSPSCNRTSLRRVSDLSLLLLHPPSPFPRLIFSLRCLSLTATTSSLLPPLDESPEMLLLEALPSSTTRRRRFTLRKRFTSTEFESFTSSSTSLSLLFTLRSHSLVSTFSSRSLFSFTNDLVFSAPEKKEQRARGESLMDAVRVRLSLSSPR